MNIIFKTEQGQAIKTWTDWEVSFQGLPMVGDIVKLYWGDDWENGERYIVKRRVYDMKVLDIVVCIVVKE